MSARCKYRGSTVELFIWVMLPPGWWQEGIGLPCSEGEAPVPWVEIGMVAV